MTEETKENQFSIAHYIAEHGEWAGFTRASDMLSRARNEPVSKQRAYRWWTRRYFNSMPDRYVVEGQSRKQFNLRELYEWSESYKPSHGGRPLGSKDKVKRKKGSGIWKKTMEENSG